LDGQRLPCFISCASWRSASSLSRCLGIPDPLKQADRSWGPILKSIRDGINAKWPNVTARAHGDGKLFDSLYASLDAVKNPWRNATMHVEDRKTETEAEPIFVAVKAFMMKVAARVRRERRSEGLETQSEPIVKRCRRCLQLTHRAT